MEKISVRKHRPGHPWIFSNEVRARKDIPPGSVVEIYKGTALVGSGFYNPHSLIAVRKYSTISEDFTAAFVERAIVRADAYRKQVVHNNSYRMVFSESDGLPGLIIDKYSDGYVMQINSQGMNRHKEFILNALNKFTPAFVYEKNDPYLRSLEGIDVHSGLLTGTLPESLKIQQDDMRFLVDIEHGQKTGFFFDLATIRQRVKALAYGRNVLDLCCYSGAFSVYAARGGAASVKAVDTSESVLALARENVVLNECGNVVFEKADVFDFLKSDNELYDLIILDPPSFTRSRRKTAEARRGYRDVNLQAIKKLKPGGYLVTTCCSYHISDHEFLRVIEKAGNRAGRTLRITGHEIQAPDHPILLAMPETYYLKCYILQAVE
ncbi:MAG: class I SAM-dependent rRNA methyltransferase [candidate division WOR-3 bacterium]|nr:MAG: class I SAM-dependent rRNA methyltransferase [candidate division WOR-3 bacterium]